jgi:hypothetical protein
LSLAYQAADLNLDLTSEARLMEMQAQLLLGELHAARRVAEQTAATLSLFVNLLGATREADGGFLVSRIFQDLLLCAESPDIASRISGCEAESIDPLMIRASAALLSGDVGAVLKSVLGEGAVAH